MTRFIMPIILIAIAASVFFVFTDPLYNQITALKAQVSSYNQALDNSKALENERDKLTAKYNAIDTNNLAKLSTFLPENVDNVRLILEIEEIAAPYGMVLKNVKYNATDSKSTATSGTTPGAAVQGGSTIGKSDSNKDYGVFDLEFSTSGTYDKFINFTKDLESNLRIVDISSVSFSSDTVPATGSGTKSSASDTYTYNFKIKTYWLKN